MAECKDEQHRRNPRQFWCVCFVLLPGSRISQGIFTASLCLSYDCDWTSAPIQPWFPIQSILSFPPCGRSSGDSPHASLGSIHLPWKPHAFALPCPPSPLSLYFLLLSALPLTSPIFLLSWLLSFFSKMFKSVEDSRFFLSFQRKGLIINYKSKS